MQTELDQPLSDHSDPILALDLVIEHLDEAMRLFAEGDSEQACVCLAEANRVLESSASELVLDSSASDLKKSVQSFQSEDECALENVSAA